MEVIFKKDVPKHIKGSIKTFIAQQHKALKDLDLYFCFFGVRTQVVVKKIGSYVNESKNFTQDAYSAVLIVGIE
jgi:hypothetical protein